MSRWAEPTADEVRDAARDVFDRPEFQREKPLLERFLEWLARQFDGLFPETTTSRTPQGGTVMGPWMQFFLWFALVVVVALLVWALVVAIRRSSGRRRKKTTTPDVAIDIEEQRTVSEWKSMAERYEAEGRWKEAVLARYRELVRRLIDDDVLPAVPGRTTRELCSDMASARIDLADAFDEATTLVELPWFADAPTGPEENARFRALAEHVVAAAESNRPAPRSAELVGSES